jgi:hypothetical protein
MVLTWHFDSPRTDDDALDAYAEAVRSLGDPARPIVVDRTEAGVRITCEGVSGARFDYDARAWVDRPGPTARTFFVSFQSHALSEILADGAADPIVPWGAGAWLLRDLVELVRAPCVAGRTERVELPARSLVRPLVPFFRAIGARPHATPTG